MNLGEYQISNVYLCQVWVRWPTLVLQLNRNITKNPKQRYMIDSKKGLVPALPKNLKTFHKDTFQLIYVCYVWVFRHKCFIVMFWILVSSRSDIKIFSPQICFPLLFVAQMKATWEFYLDTHTFEQSEVIGTFRISPRSSYLPLPLQDRV